MAWSFSKLINYERCPHILSFKPMYGTQKESNPHAFRGIQLHAECAAYLSRQTTEISIPGFDFDTLRDKTPLIETKLRLDDAPWNEFVFIPDALVIEDSSIIIIDFKTGKREYNEIKHAQQMQLYACALNTLYPNKLFINAELWYLDHKFVHSATLKPSRLAGMQVRFINRAAKMLSDKELKPNPSKNNCRFCEHNQHCEYAYETI